MTERTGQLEPRSRRIWDGVEAKVLYAFEATFNTSGLGPDDCFFELGGDSLTAARLVSLLATRFGRPPTIAELFEYSTVESLSTLLRSRERSHSSPSTVVPLTSDRRAALPLVFAHAVTGEVLHAVSLSPLRLDRSLYLVRSAGLDNEEPPLRTVPAMVHRYVTDLDDVLPAGPVGIAGYSMGGLVAMRLAPLLRGRGYEVPIVVLIGTLPPSMLTGRGVSHEEWMFRRLWQWVRRAMGAQAAEHLAARWHNTDEGLRPLLPQLVEDLRELSFFPPDVDLAQALARLEVFACNSEAALACELSSYDGAVASIRAVDDVGYDWATVVTGPLQHYTVADPHDAMLLGGSEAIALMSKVLSQYDPVDGGK